MMRSMYAGVAGLRTHQTKMDVIGNNIANVNTVGYKSMNITFQELLYQTTSSASGPDNATGRAGINAKQIGLGVTTGAINTQITTPGASQTTGNPFDIRITGDSFFIVSDGVSNYFTKAGAFYVDSAGTLAMTTNGYTVMGWKPDPNDPSIIRQDTVEPLQIMSAENLTVPPTPTTLATASGIIDVNNASLNSDDGAIYNLNFYDNMGYKYIAKFSVKAVNKATREFSIELTDILNAGDKGRSICNGDPDVLRQMVSFGGEGQLSTTLKYDQDEGTFEYIMGEGIKSTMLSFNPDYTDPATGETMGHFSDVEIDFSTTNNFDNNGTSTFGLDSGDLKNNGAGKQMGNMIGISISNNGEIYGTYDNGDKKLLGQIAVASFSNASGLQKEGENLYSETMNSGRFDGIGQVVTADGGGMTTGVLEMSNVDLSLEFTEMITTQRGFQANSRIITTSDSILEELVNLKR
ncbi:MAG: flagellar hook protein FlgE [Lachnospiraceae bacterium]|nr:flagellar hook protein FlgE [Lachnospiraceae bacterium]